MKTLATLGKFGSPITLATLGKFFSGAVVSKIFFTTIMKVKAFIESVIEVKEY